MIKYTSFILFIFTILTVITFYCFLEKREPFTSKEEQEMEDKAFQRDIIASNDTYCMEPSNPAYVCSNYKLCCKPQFKETQNVQENNACICSLPENDKCQKEYKQCLKNNILSKKDLKRLGKDNKQDYCLSFLSTCCSHAGPKAYDESKNTNFKVLDMVVPDKTKGDYTCSILTKNKKECESICSRSSKCRMGVFNENMQTCELYDHKKTIPREQAFKESDQYYHTFVEPFETFMKSCEEVNPYYEKCRNYSEKCKKRNREDPELCEKLKDACLSGLHVFKDSVNDGASLVKTKSIKSGDVDLLCQDNKNKKNCFFECKLNPKCEALIVRKKGNKRCTLFQKRNLVPLDPRNRLEKEINKDIYLSDSGDGTAYKIDRK